MYYNYTTVDKSTYLVGQVYALNTYLTCKYIITLLYSTLLYSTHSTLLTLLYSAQHMHMPHTHYYLFILHHITYVCMYVCITPRPPSSPQHPSIHLTPASHNAHRLPYPTKTNMNELFMIR